MADSHLYPGVGGNIVNFANFVMGDLEDFPGAASKPHAPLEFRRLLCPGETQLVPSKSR